MKTFVSILAIYIKYFTDPGKGKCDEKYIREEDLVGSIAKLVDQFKTKQLKIHSKVTREVQKFNEMQKQTMGNEAKEIDTQGYIQYILKNGTHLEKREFLQCLDGQLYLKGGEVWLEEIRI